jgi:hypothetical protein
MGQALKTVSLDDKYALDKTRAYMTGIEALVRLPILQHQRDRKRGLNTAGFISGYRGSPLGGVDQAMWKARPWLDRHNIHFQPGVNEDLAATAVWGSQQTNLFEGAKYDGVFGMWYGKGPGVDRSMDVIKHANAFGTAPHGGVLAVAGDDHGCKSSTLPHQSEHMFIGASVPVLSPANVQEVLDLGVFGWELSAVALQRHLGGPQGDHREHGFRHLRRHRPRSHQYRYSRGIRVTGRRRTRALAGQATGPGTSPEQVQDLRSPGIRQGQQAQSHRTRQSKPPPGHHHQW